MIPLLRLKIRLILSHLGPVVKAFSLRLEICPVVEMWFLFVTKDDGRSP
jgi:hypothetical protein